MAKARVRAEIDLDGRKFGQGVAKAKTQVHGFGKQLGGIKTLVAGAFSVGIVGGFARSVIGLGSQLSDLADQAGLTTDEFQALEFAVLDAGGKSELVTKTMVKLNQSVGAAKTGLASYKDAFDRLGISMDDLNSATGPQLLEMLARAEGATKDYDLSLILGARNASRMTEVLRKMGAEGFAPMLTDAQKATRFMSAETIAVLDELSDKIGRAKRGLQGFLGQAIVDLVEVNKGLLQIPKALIFGSGSAKERLKQGIIAGGASIDAGEARVAQRTADIQAQRKLEKDTAAQVALQQKQLAEAEAFNNSFNAFRKEWDRRIDNGTF